MARPGSPPNDFAPPVLSSLVAGDWAESQGIPCVIEGAGVVARTVTVGATDTDAADTGDASDAKGGCSNVPSARGLGGLGLVLAAMRGRRRTRG